MDARAAGRAIVPGDGRLCTVMPSLPLSPGATRRVLLGRQPCPTSVRRLTNDVREGTTQQSGPLSRRSFESRLQHAVARAEVHRRPGGDGEGALHDAHVVARRGWRRLERVRAGAPTRTPVAESGDTDVDHEGRVGEERRGQAVGLLAEYRSTGNVIDVAARSAVDVTVEGAVEGDIVG